MTASSCLARVARISLLTLLVPGGFAVAGCSGSEDVGPTAPVEETEDELRTSYGELTETLRDGELDQWIGVRRALASGFDRVCGDTICGGDFSNLATVRITCSSTLATRKLKDCTWVLGGNIDYVNGRTGKMTGEARAFTCKIPVAGTAPKMVAALAAAGDDALHTPIPGTDKSFYDGLVECFSGVTGAPPPAEDATFYAELQDYLWSAGDTQGLAWNETQRKLAQGFDDVCGDSFCEGEYSDITALRLACSVNRNSQRVSRCQWTFAAANTSVGAAGKISADTTTKTCTFPIDAKAGELTSALAGDDPLNAKLPGKDTSIYDALIGCL